MKCIRTHLFIRKIVVAEVKVRKFKNLIKRMLFLHILISLLISLLLLKTRSVQKGLTISYGL